MILTLLRISWMLRGEIPRPDLVVLDGRLLAPLRHETLHRDGHRRIPIRIAGLLTGSEQAKTSLINFNLIGLFGAC